MAIPLVTMLAVLGTIGVQSVQNYRNVKRAPQLILSTAEQSAFFFLNVIAERRAAVVYLSSPNPANMAAYTASVNTTKAKLAAFDAQMVSPTVTSAEDSAEKAGIAKAIRDLGNMGQLRLGVEAKKVSPFLAWEGYTKIMQDQPAIFEAEASSFSNATSLKESFGLIQVVLIREDISEMDSLLAGGLAANNMTVAERDAFGQAYGRLIDQENTFPALLNQAEQNAYTKDISAPQIKQAYAQILKISDAVAGGVPLAELKATGVTSQSWQRLTSAWGNASFQGGVDAASQHLIVDQNIANNAKTRLIAAAGAGGAAIILTLLVTLLLARSVNRRLTLLRRNAVVLATEHLPNIVARLRRGENVDVAASAPALRIGADEIGQVGQAFDMVRQTALRSAVEESRLRQGVNDMFRNLARRNQSLLQRQLTMLDGMERRANDPDVLDDLFKMDHLTTRMRRHAEGLIILSGAAPGRGWSTPVKLIDVMRGAVAEVEDFARVIVTTQSKAALTGGAVTDVIHLLAELIENATTLSPPFTQVRVHGEMVANGFAIEVEDRGLGMTPMRMGELNERLANPPDVNPANTEQLGLFVVGQLARRHSINVALRPSPYGGTTAIVMIPQRLVVDDATPAIGTGTGPQAAAAPGNGGPGAGGGFPGAYGPGPHTPGAGFPRAGFG
ncbi:MAG: nitrate- and nitrite sensing domain-containing protein, partial [Streptosporangiales bacterium]|nr:nitrate- and nitrite sensing domain-containing protein [Streptosporangiales bacterium]